jgi:protein tyrosine phosphatase (PTP) superfamily phosphohydrolase (DUF442 family)
MRLKLLITSSVLLAATVMFSGVVLLADAAVYAGPGDPLPVKVPGILLDASPAAERLPSKHLPNPILVHPKVISGGQPEGQAGFAELRELGVKTVISVDGAMPDVETAKKYGLRYVHLPHGYDGIPEERAKDLAKAVRDLPGPIYIHCHHGKHRSPAAAAVACVAAGLVDPVDARGILELAGTSENYRGLYRSAERARPLDPEVLDRLTARFPETAELPPMAEAMVEIERSFDRMKAVAEAGWISPPHHPDVGAAHEALLLRELFTELLRTEDTWTRSEGFPAMLQESEQAAKGLEAALQADTVDPAAAQAALHRVAANCAACHKTYRDVPLGEKHLPSR